MQCVPRLEPRNKDIVLDSSAYFGDRARRIIAERHRSCFSQGSLLVRMPRNTFFAFWLQGEMQ